jgi:hypothetical protein
VANSWAEESSATRASAVKEPTLQNLIHWVINSPLGATGALLIGFVVGGYLVKKLIDHWLGYLLLLLLLGFVLKNFAFFQSSKTNPVPGKPGAPLGVALLDDPARYRDCLWGYIRDQPNNALLQNAARVCEAARADRYWACKREIANDYTIVSKDDHCLADAGKIWTTCAESALNNYPVDTWDATPVTLCQSGRTIDLMRNFAAQQSRHP